jgi:hypothetical protein
LECEEEDRKHDGKHLLPRRDRGQLDLLISVLPGFALVVALAGIAGFTSARHALKEGKSARSGRGYLVMIVVSLMAFLALVVRSRMQ